MAAYAWLTPRDERAEPIAVLPGPLWDVTADPEVRTLCADAERTNVAAARLMDGRRQIIGEIATQFVARRIAQRDASAVAVLDEYDLLHGSPASCEHD